MTRIKPHRTVETDFFDRLHPVSGCVGSNPIQVSHHQLYLWRVVLGVLRRLSCGYFFTREHLSWIQRVVANTLQACFRALQISRTWKNVKSAKTIVFSGFKASFGKYLSSWWFPDTDLLLVHRAVLPPIHNYAYEYCKASPTRDGSTTICRYHSWQSRYRRYANPGKLRATWPGH